MKEGTRLGHYEIRSKIGEGGMGEVYLAEDLRLHRKVALKILPPIWLRTKTECGASNRKHKRPPR